MASAIRSIALPICGRAVFTAAATFVSFATALRGLRLKAFRGELLSLRFLQSLNYRVMYLWTYLLDRFILAVRPGAVCEKSYRKLTLRVDPQGCSCVTEMPKRIRREIFPRL